MDGVAAVDSATPRDLEQNHATTTQVPRLIYEEAQKKVRRDGGCVLFSSFKDFHESSSSFSEIFIRCHGVKR